MKKIIIIISLFLFTYSTAFAEKNLRDNIMNIKINNTTFKAKLEKNDTADKIIEYLKNNPVNVNVSNYGGFEIVGQLPFKNLPKNDRHINTNTGDIMLYQGKHIVIFYGSNSWDYTPIGKIIGSDDETIKKILSSNPVNITLSID